MLNKYIRINKNDNVIVALNRIDKGEIIIEDNISVKAFENIERGHKMALFDIEDGADVIKYGYSIGHANGFIRAGEHVHVHNMSTNLGENLEYTYNPAIMDSTQEIINNSLPDSFMGYVRQGSRVGIRNEIWIIPTVGCVNGNARKIANECQHLLCDKVDAIVAFNHPYGCSQMGEDQENTRHILADLIRHPNAGGVLVLGLGCENSGVDVLKQYIEGYDASRVRFLVCQDVDDEIDEGIKCVQALVDRCMSDNREKVPVSELVIGMKCGGSDGLSGISANPTVGRFSDVLISHGATTILTEVPEMFGAETLLLNRAMNKDVFDKTVKMINDFKDYFRLNGQTIYENPSPGNKEGGISTLEDKALGCTQKSGSSPVTDVLPYGGRVTNKGLNLLYAPGNDLVSSTALSAAGAQLILFTTGRGTPFACPIPTLKLSTNTALFMKKKNWIDFNCGSVAEGIKSIDELAEELYLAVIDTANGKKVKSEEAGYYDLAIFKQGVTL